MKDILDNYQKNNPKQFKISYVLSLPRFGWDGMIGRVDSTMIKSTMPLPGKDVLVVVCGPYGFVELVSGLKMKDKQGELKGILKELEYTGKLCIYYTY